MKWRYEFFSVLMSVLSYPAVNAQTTAAGDMYDESLANALSVYYAQPAARSRLTTGSEYLRYPFYIADGHPYLVADTLSRGSLHYKDVVFSDIPLLYDQVYDDLVTPDASGTSLIRLVKPLISGFELYGRKFARIDADSLSQKIVSPGFYEVIHEGTVTVLKKETKILKERIGSDNNLQKFIQSSVDYFISKDGVYHRIDNIRSLQDAFGNRSGEIASFIKNNNLKFKRNTEAVILKAASFYEQLR